MNKISNEGNVEEKNMSDSCVPYSVNVSSFEELIEKELVRALKLLSRSGALNVSVKLARETLRSGVAVAKKLGKKKSGRPKKSVRDVSDDDLLSDLTAKADCEPKKLKSTSAEKAAAKCLKLAANEEAKQAKVAAKELLKEQKAAKSKLANEKKESKRLEKEAKSLAKAQEKSAKIAEKAAAKCLKLAANEEAKQAKVAAKQLLKEQKATKSKSELARKSKEAKALKKQFNIKSIEPLEELTEEPILNEAGEVIGSKVSSFTLAEFPAVVKETEEIELPDGLELFKHDSRPNEKLYKDAQEDVFAINEETCELEHIATYDSASGTLIGLSDNDSDSESELEDLSDTEC